MGGGVCGQYRFEVTGFGNIRRVFEVTGFGNIRRRRGGRGSGALRGENNDDLKQI
jgi:hypothetical protein